MLLTMHANKIEGIKKKAMLLINYFFYDILHLKYVVKFKLE